MGPNDVWGLSLPFSCQGPRDCTSIQIGRHSLHQGNFWKWNPHTFTQVLLEKSVTLTSVNFSSGFDAQKLKALKITCSACWWSHIKVLLFTWRRGVWDGLFYLVYGMAGNQFSRLQQPPSKVCSRWIQVLSHSTIWVDESQSALRSSSLLSPRIYPIKNGKIFINPVLQQSWKILVESRWRDLLRVLGRDEDFIKILAEGISLSKLRERWIQAALQFQIEVTGFELLAVPEARSGMALYLLLKNKSHSKAAWKKCWTFFRRSLRKLRAIFISGSYSNSSK